MSGRPKFHTYGLLWHLAAFNGLGPSASLRHLVQPTLWSTRVQSQASPPNLTSNRCLPGCCCHRQSLIGSLDPRSRSVEPHRERCRGDPYSASMRRLAIYLHRTIWLKSPERLAEVRWTLRASVEYPSPGTCGAPQWMLPNRCHLPAPSCAGHLAGIRLWVPAFPATPLNFLART